MDGTRTTAKHVEVTEVAETAWLKLQSIRYTNVRGDLKVWDRVVRQPAPATEQKLPPTNCGTNENGLPSGFTTKRDSAGIVALTFRGMIQSSLSASVAEHGSAATAGLILVKQYRPALDAMTIELPAGLVDSGESVAQCAVRELKEETGYSAAEVVFVSPKVASSVGISNESVHMVCLKVDLDDPLNAKPTQKLEEDESIDVEHIPLRELITFLNSQSAQGVAVAEGLYGLALGLTLASKDPLEALKVLMPKV